MNNILEINDLSFSYDRDLILSNLNMEVKPYEFNIIIGDNGAGKSTLLNLILNNLKTKKKTIKLFGDYIENNNHYDDISYISQNAVVNYRNFPTTIEEALKVHLSYLKKDVDINKYLKMIKLDNYRYRRLNELSGGQLQRFGVLLALVKDAKLIILDEPTSGVDVKFSKELYEILRNLCDEGKSCIMVTHSKKDVIKYVNKVFEIRNGNLITTEGEVC